MEGLVSVIEAHQLTYIDVLRYNAYLDMRADIEAAQAEEAKQNGRR